MTDQKEANRINAMTPKQLKTFEDRLRRMALRQGLTMLKSRIRDPRARGWQGYMIADEQENIVTGDKPFAYAMSIDEIERYLLGDK